MKKTFITLLTILYLIFGIGVGSVHHYCKTMQEDMMQCDSPCCSTEQESESSRMFCCNVEEKAAPSYCSSEPTNSEDELTITSDECCAVEHKFNQVSPATSRQSIDVTTVAKLINEPFHYPQNLQSIERDELMTFTNPSNRLNLPLLI